jgi:hypothetical protein
VFYYKDGKKAYLAEGMADWEQYLAVFDGDKKCLLEFMPDGSPESLAGEAAALNKLCANS